jgi:chromodomain-helicase-DNA-binding protein 4
VSEEIEPKGLAEREAHLKLIEASAKLRLLKTLLPALKARGHRVLLFSQFAIGLDIIEDFLSGEGFNYLRLVSIWRYASSVSNARPDIL